ncbi:MAG: hypothetical protein OIN86_10915 [Candidatus Methanoperedens sp.]|nr:hypothetical protein [Candidatus Methanoperedens sp.]
MNKFVVLLIILWFASFFPVAAFSTNEIEWAPAVEGTLSRGSTLTNEPYMVKAVQFPSPVAGYKNFKGEIIPETSVIPMVYLDVYKNGTFIKEALLTMQSGPELDSDYEFKISATEFLPGNSKEWVQEYYNPWAKVAISLRGKPKLDVTVTTEKASYTSSSDQIITATVNIKNNGDAIAKNVDVILNADELYLRGGNPGQLHQLYIELKKGEIKSYEVVFSVPDVVDQETYNLSADTKSFDVKDLEYRSKGSVSITVSPKQNYYSVSKAFSKNRIYLNDIIMVRLNIANNGAQDMTEIILTDTINPNFELKSISPLTWNIPVLKPGEWKDIGYSIKPLETNINGFTFPEVNAQFKANNKQYNISSNTSTVIVNGPKIIINKTLDKQIVNISEDVTVTVTVQNIGNIATRTEVKDFIPENVSLVSGSTSLDSTFLELNTPIGFSYIIRINTGENIELPAAIANYTGVEYGGMTRSSIKSGRPVITVIDPAINRSINNAIPTLTPNIQETNSGESTLPQVTSSPPPEPSPTPVTPGFDIFLGIIILLFAAVFRTLTKPRNK